MALADAPLDTVVEPHGLDAAGEHRKERALVAGARRELARGEADVRGCTCDPLALRLGQLGEDRDAGDLVGGHHRAPDRGRFGGPAAGLRPPPVSA